MKEEYISISEFAKRAGVSVQAVYKRLDKDIQPWLKELNGKKVLNIKALEVFKGEKTSTEVESTEALMRMVSMLEKELEIKNEQIREQSRQISELHDRLKESYLLIDHQQKLTAAGLLTTPSPELKTDETENAGEADTEELTPTVDQMEPPKKKKKHWQFWK
jgi:DNA-binding transcriptional MerR regulator